MLACFLFPPSSFSLPSSACLFYLLVFLIFSFSSFLFCSSFFFLLLIPYFTWWFYLFYNIVLNNYVIYFKIRTLIYWLNGYRFLCIHYISSLFCLLIKKSIGDLTSFDILVLMMVHLNRNVITLTLFYMKILFFHSSLYCLIHFHYLFSFSYV